MRQLQETAHGPQHDYRAGSPHIKHARLYQALLGELRNLLHSLRDENLPWSVLDVGAGHGSFTEPLLAYGCRVTAIEMSRASASLLRARYGDNDRFSVVLDDGGTLKALGDEMFSLVLFASVLHHIPNYEAAIETATVRVVPSGALVVLQDPLWYPTLGHAQRLLSRIAYLSWRLGRGDYVRGVKSRWRWATGAYDDRNPSDMVEYHVVRKGINQEGLQRLLSRSFHDVKLVRYWSTQSSLWQRVGEALGAHNTFAIIATHRLPSPLLSYP